MCELEKPLEERLTEGRGQVELLTAVVNLRFYHMATSIYKKSFTYLIHLLKMQDVKYVHL